MAYPILLGIKIDDIHIFLNSQVGETGAQWKGKVSIDFTLQENVNNTDFHT